jgi:myo-inositol-1(or 4)-monophosphatase
MTLPGPAHDPTLDTDLRLVRAVIAEAGEMAAHFFSQRLTGWDKSPNNPVSEADLAIDDLIRRRLQGARPDYGWLSEESADDPGRLECRRLWVVDPIDGTRAFLKGRDGYCVSIALVVDGSPVIGALNAPARGLLFEARRGDGATLNGRPILAAPTTVLAGARMLASSDLFNPKFWPEPWPEMAISTTNSIALRLALVAAGEADVALALSAESEWDVAAAHLILEEAGAILTDHEGRQPRYNNREPTVPMLVASAPGLHGTVLARVQAGVAAWRAREASGRGQT